MADIWGDLCEPHESEKRINRSGTETASKKEYLEAKCLIKYKDGVDLTDESIQKCINLAIRESGNRNGNVLNLVDAMQQSKNQKLQEAIIKSIIDAPDEATALILQNAVNFELIESDRLVKMLLSPPVFQCVNPQANKQHSTKLFRADLICDILKCRRYIVRSSDVIEYLFEIFIRTCHRPSPCCIYFEYIVDGMDIDDDNILNYLFEAFLRNDDIFVKSTLPRKILIQSTKFQNQLLTMLIDVMEGRKSYRNILCLFDAKRVDIKVLEKLYLCTSLDGNKNEVLSVLLSSTLSDVNRIKIISYYGQSILLGHEVDTANNKVVLKYASSNLNRVTYEQIEPVINYESGSYSDDIIKIISYFAINNSKALRLLMELTLDYDLSRKAIEAVDKIIREAMY